MTDKEFFSMINIYLSSPKMFMPVPDRIKEVKQAYEIAQKLFPDSKITIEPDPLQTGALVLSVTGYDITLNNSDEISLFYEMVCNASNFEIVPAYFEEEKVKFGAIFYGAYALIP